MTLLPGSATSNATRKNRRAGDVCDANVNAICRAKAHALSMTLTQGLGRDGKVKCDGYGPPKTQTLAREQLALNNCSGSALTVEVDSG